MAKLNRNLNEAPADRDDLQQIKGIGPFMAEALNNLGIYHFRDLANYTPESLANLLKATTGAITSHRIERDNWLGQAQILARHQKKPKAPAETDEVSSPSPEQMGEQPDQLPSLAVDQATDENALLLSTEAEQRDKTKAARPNWRELADFFVSFGYAIDEQGEEHLETRVHYSQVDTSEQWAGIAATQLISWIAAQANLPLSLDRETQVKAEPLEELPAALPAVEEEIVTLELSDLWVSEVKTPATVAGEHPTEGMLRAVSRLSLSGAGANKLTADHLPFRVELYLVNIETNRSKAVVSQAGQLIPGALTYEIEQDFPLPALGRYQIYLVAMLLPPGDAATHLQGPIIRVEPG